MDRIKQEVLKYKILLWPIITGISFLVILTFVIIPQIGAYLDIRNQIFGLRGRSNSLEVKAEELNIIDSSKMQKDLQTALTVLPQNPDVPEALLTLQETILKSGLILKDTSYVATGNAGRASSFLLNITVLGQINSLRNFLINLQTSPRVFQVEAISVKFQQGALMEAEIPVSVFYHPLTPVSTNIDQEAPKLSEKEEKLLTDLAKMVSAPILNASESATFVPLGKTNPFE